MPRYYFHLRKNDVYETDLEGAELASDELARSEAIYGARELVAERVKRGEIIGNDIFEVSDDRGRIVFTVALSSVLRLT